MKRLNAVCIPDADLPRFAARAGLLLLAGLLVSARAVHAQNAGAAPEAALERLQRDYLTLARAASATAAELARLKEDHRLADAARTTAERDRERLTTVLTRLRDEFGRNLDATAALQRDLSATLDAQIKLQGELSERDKALADLRRRHERLERQSEDSAAQRVAMDELRRERDRLLRERAEMERRLARAGGAPGTVDPRRPAPSPAPVPSAPNRAEIERVQQAAEQDRAALIALQELLEAQLTDAIAARERDRDEHRRERASFQKAVEALRARAAATNVAPSGTAPPVEPIPAPDSTPDLRAAMDIERKDREVLNREIATLTDHAVALERRIAELQESVARAAEADALAAALGEARRDALKARERGSALEALLEELRSAAKSAAAKEPQ